MFVSGDNSTVVVDIGTETYKMGYSNLEYPTRYSSSAHCKNNFVSPVCHSVVSDTTKYMEILTECIPSDTSYMLVAQNTYEKKETQQQVLTECMERGVCESLFFTKSAVLDAFAYGKTTALVFSISGGSTQICSVVDGYITQRRREDFGCYDVTMKFFDKSMPGCEKSHKEIERARALKEDFYIKLQNVYDNYTGSVVDIQYENQYNNVHTKIIECAEYINDIVSQNPADTRTALLSNIVISGGGSMICMIASCIEKALGGEQYKIHCVPSTFHTFFGGTIMGNIGSFKRLHIGKLDYQEYGVSILDRKPHLWIRE